jgi:multiple sugar transport system substrate-binding protein
MWFGLSGQQAEHHARVNERFSSEHPQLQVELLTVPESELTAKLATAIAGGRPPDLAGLGGATRIAELIEHKRVVSLTRYRRDLARLDWYDALKRVVVRGDDIFALPTQAATLGLFYNADLYQRAGLDSNAPPATWAELLTNARAIARPEQQRWGHAIGTKPITWTAEQIWIAYLWQAGGEWLTPDGKQAAFNSAAGVEALEFWADLVQKHQVTPPKAVDNLIMGDDFAAGTVAHMTIYSIWVIRAEGMRFPVRTAPLPRHRQPASVAAMVTVPIFSESRQRDAAWAYLDWLSQPDHLIYYLSGFGTTPPRKSVAESAAWTAFAAQHPLLQPFVDSQPQARLPYFGTGAQEIAIQVAQGIEAAVFGQKSPRQALDDAARQVNAILARA